MLHSYGIYALAALAEIAGCFSFWAWYRMDKSTFWLILGVICLALFAYLLALVETAHAGRAYAAYGGIYIIASLLWLWLVENTRPTAFDISGALLCLIGASVILYGSRVSLAG